MRDLPRLYGDLRSLRQRAEGAMLVFGQAGLVLLAVPKTGTTAYETALAPHASIVIRDPPELKHAPLYRYNRFLRPMLEKFHDRPPELAAVMRDPRDWLGSWYRFRSRPFLDGRPESTAGHSFDAFVRAYCQAEPPPFARVGAQAQFLAPRRNGTKVDHLFRYEAPEQFHAFLEARLQIRFATGRENVSPRLPLELTEETEALMRRHLAADFRLYEGIC